MHSVLKWDTKWRKKHQTITRWTQCEVVEVEKSEKSTIDMIRFQVRWNMRTMRFLSWIRRWIFFADFQLLLRPEGGRGGEADRVLPPCNRLRRSQVQERRFRWGVRAIRRRVFRRWRQQLFRRELEDLLHAGEPNLPFLRVHISLLKMRSSNTNTLNNISTTYMALPHWIHRRWTQPYSESSIQRTKLDHEISWG